MTNEQINKAIAEELGWKPHPKSDNHWVLPDGSFTVLKFHVCHNAVAKMREVIHEDDRFNYLNHLDLVIDNGRACMISAWALVDSTPRQQAEAFLRMRGKWVA